MTMKPMLLLVLLIFSQAALADTDQEPYVDCVSSLAGVADDILPPQQGGPLMLVEKDRGGGEDRGLDQDIVVLLDQYHGYGNKRVKGFYVFTVDRAYFYPDPVLKTNDTGDRYAFIRLDFEGKKSVYLNWWMTKDHPGTATLWIVNPLIDVASQSPGAVPHNEKFKALYRPLGPGDVWDGQTRQAMAAELARRIATVAKHYIEGPESYKNAKGEDIHVIDEVRDSLGVCGKIDSQLVRSAIREALKSLARLETIRGPVMPTARESKSTGAD